ncbi:MAG: hypothetical protein KH147_00465 [Actinomyces graevenitzii]|nr:hypothetical protein [Actinomyces graevenitzii]
MRALVWFGLDGAASLYSHDDDGVVGIGLWAVTCAPPQVRAPSTLRKKPPSPQEKSHRHRHTRVTQKLTKKSHYVTISRS